jgi:hypothetical protein
MVGTVSMQQPFRYLSDNVSYPHFLAQVSLKRSPHDALSPPPQFPYTLTSHRLNM